MCGAVRKARGCSVLCRSRMGSATLCRDGCFGGRPCALHTEQGTGVWKALGCSVEGAGGEGMRAGSLSGLGIWGQCSQQVDRGCS